MEAIWKCRVEGCNFTAPPTAKGYKQMTGHMLGHASKGLGKEKRIYALVDKDTEEVLANTIIEAREKGLLVEEGGVTPPVPPAPPAAEVRSKEKEDEKKETTVTAEGILTYYITLPSDAFTLFNLAKASGLEKDGEKPFDEWVWDCITARFRTDYKMRLVLAPIGEEESA